MLANHLTFQLAADSPEVKVLDGLDLAEVDLEQGFPALKGGQRDIDSLF